MSTNHKCSYPLCCQFLPTANLETSQKEAWYFGVVHHMCQVSYNDAVEEVSEGLDMGEVSY